jgi:hypothetical protein
MSYRSIVALALGLAATFAINADAVYAQRVSNRAYRHPLPRPVPPAKGRMFRAAYAEEELPGMGEQSRLAPSQPGPSQPLPPQNMPANPFSDDSGPMLEYGQSDDCCEDYCSDMPCDVGCCDTCQPHCVSSQCFITADYLYLRSSFSDSVEFVDVDSQQTETDQSITQFEFDYESSFRFGGGYRLCGCGDEIRFMYTRMESSAFDQQDAGDDITVPYLISAPLGGEYRFHADVEINSYELEYSKAIPLGGPACGGGCGDVCGGCSSGCPAWDVSWTGGFRVADAEWRRAYVALGTTDEFLEDAVSTMEFDGAGLKVGLQGRRYFCKSGWLSVYAKGDLSLLYGDLEFTTVATTEGGTAPDAIVRQSTTTNQIIPVTELEAGVTGQISCNGRISAGYLLSAWHDLGFRDEFPFNSMTDVEIPIQYDDANILGFDGFFARLEYAF